MTVSQLESWSDFISEKAVKCVCKNCRREYNLKETWKCPFCGAFPEKNQDR